jgi:DNA topoisomerase-2
VLAEQEQRGGAAEKGGAKGKKGASDDSSDSGKPVMMLKSYEAAYNDVDVDFILHMDPDYYHEARAYPSEFEAKFRLTTSFKSSNMVAFNVGGKIHKFDTVGEIMEVFYQERLRKYAARKAHQLAQLAEELRELDARLVFIRAVVEGRLKVANAEDDVLLAGLRALKLPALSEGEGLKGYEYLLRMRVDRLKAAAVLDLERDVQTAKDKVAALSALSAEALWLRDLDDFSAAWESYTGSRMDAYTAVASEMAVIKKKPTAARKPRTAAKKT